MDPAFGAACGSMCNVSGDPWALPMVVRVDVPACAAVGTAMVHFGLHRRCWFIWVVNVDLEWSPQSRLSREGI